MAWLQKLRYEEKQLAVRIEGLRSFIGTETEKALPAAERADLRLQLQHMGLYLNCLRRRIERAEKPEKEKRDKPGVVFETGDKYEFTGVVGGIYAEEYPDEEKPGEFRHHVITSDGSLKPNTRYIYIGKFPSFPEREEPCEYQSKTRKVVAKRAPCWNVAHSTASWKIESRELDAFIGWCKRQGLECTFDGRVFHVYAPDVVLCVLPGHWLIKECGDVYARTDSAFQKTYEVVK